MKKIVIIEDNKDLQDIYRHSFEKDGYHVVTCNDGESGLEKTIAEFPTVVLLDLMMPGINGYDFLKKIRDIEGFDIPIIVCSNISDLEMIEKAIEGGAFAVLLKVDYVGKQLVDKVNHLVEDYQQKVKNIPKKD